MCRRNKVDQQVRIVADLYEKSILKNYEKAKKFGSLQRYFEGEREAFVPPLDLVPADMLERRISDIW